MAERRRNDDPKGGVTYTSGVHVEDGAHMILAQNSLAQSDELRLIHGCLPRSETAGRWIDYLRLYTREMCELGRVVVLNWTDEELEGMTDTRSPAPDATATVRVCGIKFIRSAFGLWRCVYIDGSLGAPSDAELSHQNYLDAIAELAAALRAEQEKGKALQQQVYDWEDREGAICPEDVGFEEVIKRLQQRVATFEVDAKRWQWINEQLFLIHDPADSLGPSQSMLCLEPQKPIDTPRPLSPASFVDICIAALAPSAGAGDLTCKKVPHSQKGGYLHAANDDSPFDVDGVMYCGRCHSAWPCSSSRPTVKP